MEYARKLEYWKAQNGLWYFHVRSSNRTVCAESKGFKRLRDCLKAVDTFTQPLAPEFVTAELAQPSNPESVYFRA
jgi:uncharacterized protein YegP (UPF0339 family)